MFNLEGEAASGGAAVSRFRPGSRSDLSQSENAPPAVGSYSLCPKMSYRSAPGMNCRCLR